MNYIYQTHHKKEAYKYKTEEEGSGPSEPKPSRVAWLTTFIIIIIHPLKDEKGGHP